MSLASRRLDLAEKLWINDNMVRFNGDIPRLLREWPFTTPPPSRVTIYNLRKKFLETGSLQNKKPTGRPCSVVNNGNTNIIRAVIEEHPKTSIRKLAIRTGIKNTSAFRMLKNIAVKPYIPRPVQFLNPNDLGLRVKLDANPQLHDLTWHSGISRLSFSEVNKELKKAQTVLLDVREKEELVSDGKIEGSKNIPLGEVADAVQLDEKSFKKFYGFDKPDPDKVNLVIHCKAGVRAMKAAVLFNQSGYSNIKVYGGILDWLENGGSVTK